MLFTLYLLLLHYPYLAHPIQFVWGGPDINLSESKQLTEIGLEEEIFEVGSISDDYWFLLTGETANINVTVLDNNLEIIYEENSQEQVKVSDAKIASLSEDSLIVTEPDGSIIYELSVHENDELIYFEDEYLAVVSTSLQIEEGEIEHQDELLFYNWATEERMDMQLADKAILQVQYVESNENSDFVYTTLDLKDTSRYKVNSRKIEQDLDGKKYFSDQKMSFNLGFTPVQLEGHQGVILAKQTGVLNFEEFEDEINYPTGQYYSDNEIVEIFYCKELEQIFALEYDQISEKEQVLNEQLVNIIDKTGEKQQQLNLRSESIAFGSHKSGEEFLIAADSLLYRVDSNGRSVHRAPWDQGEQGELSETGSEFLKVDNGNLMLYELKKEN